LTIRDVLERVASEFPGASTQIFAGHNLANFMRGQGANAIKAAIARDDLIVKGSPGQANWADVPWFAVFQPEITENATKGYYVVYLFNAAMTQVSLSLGQGVFALRKEFGRFAKQEMLRRSALIRDRVPEYRDRFRPGPLQLGGKTQLAKDYDPAVAFHITYKLDALPPEDKLSGDLLLAVDLYETLISRGGVDNVETALAVSTLLAANTSRIAASSRTGFDSSSRPIMITATRRAVSAQHPPAASAIDMRGRQLSADRPRRASGISGSASRRTSRWSTAHRAPLRHRSSSPA
jgi:hypothetical protein